MVFTVAVVIRGGHTRRRVLAGAVGTAAVTAAAGCGLFDDNEKPKPPDALQPLLTEAQTLAATFDAAALAQPSLAKRLTPLAADHRAHVAALAQVIGTTPPSAGPSSAPASASDATALVKQLRSAVQTASKNAAAACGTAAADRAALVGSIAACRATHAEVLR
jgi:hypothetical protein